MVLADFDQQTHRLLSTILQKKQKPLPCPCSLEHVEEGFELLADYLLLQKITSEYRQHKNGDAANSLSRGAGHYSNEILSSKQKATDFLKKSGRRMHVKRFGYF